jgi:TolB protein
MRPKPLFTTVVAALAAALAAAPAYATFPGENGKISFERPIGRQADLFTINPDGTGLSRLLRSPRVEMEAVWSPDGRRIAFARSEPGGFPFEIWTMSARGRGLRKLTRHGAFSNAPYWSPRGNRIAYFTDADFPPPGEDEPPPPPELHVIGADGRNDRRLTNDRAVQIDPAWSPDGRKVAFSLFRSVTARTAVLFVMNADGTGVRRLTPFSRTNSKVNANWSPDGSKIVFEIMFAVSRERGPRSSDIFVMNADGSGVRRLTRSPKFDTNPVWSPDGTKIAFTSDRHLPGQRRRLNNAFELYTMNADGSNVTRLTRNSLPEFFPDWQPLRRGGGAGLTGRAG